MPRRNSHQEHPHTPENAEFEIRKALASVIEAEITQTWNQKPYPSIQPGEATLFYKYAFQAWKTERRLAAERWARTAKHLARALKQEEKLRFLDLHFSEYPSLKCTPAEEYALTERKEMTIDLINSVREMIQGKFNPIPDNMKRYLERARVHIEALTKNQLDHVLIAERVSAGYEYGRVLECLILAYEAEPNVKMAA